MCERIAPLLLLFGLTLCMAGRAALAAEPPEDAAPSPVEFARVATQSLFDILRDPDLQGDINAEARYQAVRKDSDKNFDWTEMARRSLARHWNRRSTQEREEFTRLFSHLIANTYLTTIERNLDAEIRYEQEDVKERSATVRTLAVTRDRTEVPIVYWLRSADVPRDPPETGTRPSWLVYDVQIEGVSMVSNYRSQFNNIIVGSSYERLLERLKERVAEADRKRAELVAAARKAQEEAQ
ncbi:MAG: ABC transporter substrate-binding protein [Candidatus Brocadiaceae bacterium]|nr:ABC transporter substrate-binding protein [Candidatus Brocadiaceae bacterium]